MGWASLGIEFKPEQFPRYAFVDKFMFVVNLFRRCRVVPFDQENSVFVDSRLTVEQRGQGIEDSQIKASVEHAAKRLIEFLYCEL